MTNVIHLDKFRQQSAPPPQPPKPNPTTWHQRTAIWVLKWHQAEVVILEAYEIAFLQNMTRWPRDPTDKQAAWLVRLARKTEKQIAAAR